MGRKRTCCFIYGLLMGWSQLGEKYLLSGTSRNVSVCITPLSTSRLIFSLLYPPEISTFPSGKATITNPDRGAGGVPENKASTEFAVFYLHLTSCMTDLPSVSLFIYDFILSMFRIPSDVYYDTAFQCFD